MTLPIPSIAPAIDLSNLATLDEPKKRRLSLPLAVAAATTAAGALAWQSDSLRAILRPKRRSVWPSFAWAGLGVGVVTLAAAWQFQRAFTREPSYEVEERRGPLEVRRYARLRIARTTVRHGWEDALDEGFRRLAAFLFGANADHKKLAMTTPVTSVRDNGGYRVAFVMPEGVEVPEPADARVVLDEVPARRVAVLRFHGGYKNGSLIEAKKSELLATAQEQGLRTRGAPSFAGYDPPTTLPAFRRNEVWVEVEG